MSSTSPSEDPGDPLVAPAGSEQTPPADGGGLRGRRRGRTDSHNMLPGRERRRAAPERFLVRLIATAGIIGIGVAIGAIMTSSGSQGWLIGLVISVVSVLLAAVLWSSRQL